MAALPPPKDRILGLLGLPTNNNELNNVFTGYSDPVLTAIVTELNTPPIQPLVQTLQQQDTALAALNPGDGISLDELDGLRTQLYILQLKIILLRCPPRSSQLLKDLVVILTTKLDTLNKIHSEKQNLHKFDQAGGRRNTKKSYGSYIQLKRY